MRHSHCRITPSVHAIRKVEERERGFLSREAYMDPIRKTMLNASFCRMPI